MKKSVRNVVIGSLIAVAGLTVFSLIKRPITKKNKIKKIERKVEEPKQEKVYHLIHVFDKKEEKSLDKVI